MWLQEMKTKDGKIRYVFYERYTDPYSGKQKRVSISKNNKSRQTQKEAAYQLNNKIADKLNQVQLKKPDLTLKQLYKEWYNIYQQQVSEGTYLPTKNMLKAPIQDIGEDALVSKIDYVLLNDILESYLYEKKLTNRYVNTIKSKLNLMMKYAKRKGYIETNPVESVELAFKRENGGSKVKDKFLDDDEIESLLAYTQKKNKRYALLFEWLYQTGERCGEGIAHQKTDIFEEDGEFVARVDGTLLYRERKIADVKKSDRPKTDAGFRDIVLSKRSVEIYNEALEMNPDGSFLFQTSHGTPIAISAVNSFLRLHKERMGIAEDKPLTSHIFRHTHISKLAELGVPMYVIQERVGHEDSKITQQIYTHVTKKAKEKLSSKLDFL